MIRVIGLGSPFGDDRAGWWVAERLQDLARADIDVMTLDRPGAALVNSLNDAHHVILIDAVKDGGRRADCVAVRARAGDQGAISSHALSIADALRLARTLSWRRKLSRFMA